MSRPRHLTGNRAEPLKAIAEGRRIYVGNLPYRAKEEDVTAFFHQEGNTLGLAAIDISIDPFNGRNPSYRVVEFDEKAQADRAMQELNGRMFMGRPLKIKPCVPKIDRLNREGKSGYVFDRWERKMLHLITEGTLVNGTVYMSMDFPSLQHSMDEPETSGVLQRLCRRSYKQDHLPALPWVTVLRALRTTLWLISPLLKRRRKR
ncbi:hypothetical protein BJX68DRAFT_260739 [Aspergillus pseudodeflectus]|uniref:RRM domain-containing protein n=1 Tax=Aspergillus pseudodeflectus TaxID=176178 RepID=A0ABR4LBP8_9EURO